MLAARSAAGRLVFLAYLVGRFDDLLLTPARLALLLGAGASFELHLLHPLRV